MTEKISTINVYRGYSQEVADSYQRSSEYVSMEDGCRIAVDVLQPTRGGERLPGPLPTVVLATGYRRAYRKSADGFNAPKYEKLVGHLPVGTLITAYEQRPMCKDAIHHGYNVVAVDFRGTGASFGANAGSIFRNGADVAQVVDWIAAQPWATDKVGMIGGSWEGVIQLATAVYHPKHLTCIIPQIPPSVANATYDGGLFLSGFARDWSEMRKGQDTQEQACPVDGPDGERLFQEVLAQRDAVYGVPSGQNDPNTNTRDVTDEMFKQGAPEPPCPELGPLGDVFDEFERISRSGTAVYLQTGWWDMTFPGDSLDLYSALDCPKRIIVGPWQHGVLPVAEPLRWFDHWLKGVDNGIDRDPPVIFSTSTPDGSAVWKGAESWPVPEVELQTLWLDGDEAAGTEGNLVEKPRETPGELSYQVDYNVGLGDCGRMRFMLRDEYIRHPGLSERAKRCMRFTGPALAEALEITGTPALQLGLTSDAAWGALHVTLEQLMPDGSVVYLSEGWLNLEHRKVSECPRPHSGPAWHSQRSEDLLPVTPGEPMDVAMELYPVSVRIEPGSRLRVCIAGTDKDNLHVPEQDPAPTLRLTVGGPQASRLLLPVDDPASRPASRILEGAFADQDPGFAFPRE